jgi:hypothetical protein
MWFNVRLALEVTVRMPAFPSRPNRAASVNVTRRNWLPLTFAIP